MHNMMMGPTWGVVLILVVGAVFTLGCFAVAFWMVFRPGEKNRNHAKYQILRHDR